MSDCYAGIPDEVLDSTWSDADLARLAQYVVSWEELAPFWGLTEAEEEVIKKDNPKYTPQKLAALRKWKAKSPDTATYRQLIRVLERMGKMGLVDKVREIVLSPEEVPAGGPGDVLSGYREFLEKSCSQLPHPGMLTHQWPIIKSPAYVQLSLSKRRMSQCSRMEHLPTGSSMFLPTIMMLMSRHENESDENESSEPEIQEVDLLQLFSECSGDTTMTIVIKGLPGSGKTTLSWHAYQLWAKRESFQQFLLFLSIPLRSTRVQQATCLADLVLHPDHEQRKVVAQAISASDGDNVCFWFDGWDEMSQEVQRESFVASFIRRDSPGCSLPRCTTVVTTRPEASNLEFSSEEIWINAPSIDQMNEIITKSVEGTDHDPSELITSLEKNTSLLSFCLKVPINVAILISLFFLFQSGLPNTQTELFKCLVLNLLLHNLKSRWKLGITSLKSFAALPDSPAESFKSICELAFNGVMNSKTVFLRSDVPSLQQQQALPVSTLSLMDISPRMEWYGIEEELTFLHTTLQEFLAAVHLTTLENEEQVRIVQEIVNSESSYQKSVLQFYVGQVGLDNSDVSTAILQTCCVALNEHGLSPYPENFSLSPFMTFVNCVFEAQSGQLCQKLTQHKYCFSSREFDIQLPFNMTRFNTTDFSRLGYFIGWFCQQKTCELTFENCYITPQQFEMFVNQVKQVWSSELHRPSLSLLLSEMFPTTVSAEFRSERIRAVCGLIKDTSLVSHFNIELFFRSPALTHYYAAMKNIIEAFARNTSCSNLILHFDITMLFLSKSAMFKVVHYSEYYALLLITFSRHVETVAFPNFFEFYYDYPLLACALRYNTNIQYLNFSRNQAMCEAAIANIAQALSYNGTVKIVDFGDWISTEELHIFLINYALHELLSVTSGLERVIVGERAYPGERETQIIKMINFTRESVSASLFKVFMVVKHVNSEDMNPAHYIFYNGLSAFVDDSDDGEISSFRDIEAD